MKRIKQLIAMLGLMLAFAGEALSVGTLIPAASRVDMVHDFNRDVVYITSGDSVLRYQVPTGTFLPPFVLGGQLGGIDISPDGGFLAVADGVRSETEVWVWLVNLQDGSSVRLTAPREFMEGGTFTVSFAADGSILTTSEFEGSGWVPLRRFNPVTGVADKLADVRQDTMLAGSGDRTRIGFAEANISDGRFGRYTLANGLVERRQWYTDGTSWFNYEIGANRDGSQLAIPTYGGTFFYNESLTKVATIGQYAGPQPIGVAYHPVENRVYFPWTTTTQVKVYDSTTFSEIDSIDFENTFSGNGNWAFVQGRTKLSGDGSLLMVSVDGGVRIYRTYAPLGASDITITTAAATPVSVALAGAIGNGGALSYAIEQNPANGVVALDGATATYTPNTGFSGSDLFRYRVNYGRAWVDASVSVSVTPPANRPPVAQADQATTKRNRAVAVAVLANDSDPDGDALTITSASGASHGTVSISGASIVYSPAKGYAGPDQFLYTISDGKGGTAAATVMMTVMK